MIESFCLIPVRSSIDKTQDIFIVFSLMQYFRKKILDNLLFCSLSWQGVHVIDLGTVADNVYVDESGDVWLGCMPVAHKALTYIDAKKGLVPSQV